MKNARLFGLLFIPLGALLSWLYLSTLNEIGVTFKFLILGPFLLGCGLGMALFPGYNLTDEEWSVKQERLKIIFSKTKTINKVIWIGLGILGMSLVWFGAFDSFFTNA